MGLLNPALLWGAAAVGVPLLIYLITRRWYQRRPWAAMEFLLRALKKNRRRIEIENLLLLIIRTSALLFLAIALTRPFLRSSVLPIAKDREENWIFAVDSSFSMGFKEGPRTLFEGAREMVTDMVSNLVKSRDRVAVVTLDAEPRVVLKPTPVTESNRTELIAGLTELTLGPRAVDLARSLEAIREVAARFEPGGEGAPAILPKKIIIFSDFQRKDWLGENGPRDPATLDLIKAIQDEGGQFAFADLKGSDRNLSLEDLSVSPEIVSRDVWVQLRATVRNWSREDFNNISLTFSVDGQEEAGLVLSVPAGGVLETPAVPYRFVEAGYHAVTAELRSDGLALDNRRFLAVRVREDAAILLVDGEPARGGLDRETLHLNVALAPDPSESKRPAEGRLTPYRPVVKTVDELEDIDPREYVVVVLANVGYLPERFLRDLRASVRDGGSLMVFLGKNADPGVYERQFGGEDPLLPGRLGEVVGDPRASFHLVPAEEAHPLVRYFLDRRDVTNLLQPIVEFRQFQRVDLPPPPPPPAQGGAAAAGPGEAPPPVKGAPRGKGEPRVRVAFRFSDPAGSPAVFDLACGQGRALWITSTADTEWNELPKWPDFVAFLYEAIPYLARFGEARINLSVGEPFRQVFEAADYAQSCVLVPPESGGTIGKAMAKIEGENRFVLTHEETWTPGIYELRLTRPGAPGAPGRDVRQFFSANIDPSEGDLRSIHQDELREHYPGLKAQVFDAARELREMGAQKSLQRGTELWRPVLWALLGLLLAETALAQFFGRRGR